MMDKIASSSMLLDLVFLFSSKYLIFDTFNSFWENSALTLAKRHVPAFADSIRRLFPNV